MRIVIKALAVDGNGLVEEIDLVITPDDMTMNGTRVIGDACGGVAHFSFVPWSPEFAPWAEHLGRKKPTR